MGKLNLETGNVGINKWQDIKDFAYELIFSDSVRVISHSIDTSFNILTGAHLEWIVNQDMQGWVVKTKKDASSLDAYKRIREIYMSYEGVKEAGNPFKYIEQNTEEMEFLGKNLRIHNEFAKVLRKVKTTLKNKGIYSTLSTKYQTEYVGTLAMRTINDPNGDSSVSEHGFGMAIDICQRKNPQIIRVNTDDQPYNTYVRFFIKKSTGFDLGTPKTVSDIKDAHNKFTSIFSNTTITSLTSDYQAIYTYNQNADNIKIDSMHNIAVKLNSLKLAYNELDSESNPDEINSISKDIEDYALRIKSLSSHINLHKYTIVFDDVANNQIQALKSKFGMIYKELSNAQSAINDTITKIEDFTSLMPVEYNLFQEKVNSFYTEQKKLCTSLYTFAIRLKSGIEAVGYGNILLQDGFCDIELDLINAFLEADGRIQWGGTFNFKIDGMHFGFTTDAAKDIVNKK